MACGRRSQRGFRLRLGFPINVASHLEVEGKHQMIREASRTKLPLLWHFVFLEMA